MNTDPSQKNLSVDHKAYQALVDEVVVLTGPTASGKSSLAIEVAKSINGEILSLDSIAVYRKMDIGTAKPSLLEQTQVTHHLIDLVEPNEEYSVACYMEAAHKAVDEIKSRGKIPIFVGGTPMFLKGILRGFNPGPPADWEFRKAVEADVEIHGTSALKARLFQVDPLAASRIHDSDVRRMIRALEFSKITGTPISHHQTQFESNRDWSECNVFTLAWPRQQLHCRINQRVESMFEQGLIEEVRNLLNQYGELSRTASQAVGYREIIKGLRDDHTREKMIEEVAAHSRQLARRQETWFRSFPEIQSIEMSDDVDISALANDLTTKIR